MKYQIRSTGLTTHEVLLDGQDVTQQIHGFNYQAEEGRVPEVYIQARPGTGVDIQGDGIIYILSKSEVKKFLEGLDPEVVKARALSNLSWDNDDIVAGTITAIAQIWEEVSGDQT